VILYHYTCRHSAYSIELDKFTLRPGLDGLLWLTDLDAPDRRGLGLTSHILDCDRTRFRFAVPDPVEAYRWLEVRKEFPPPRVRLLEADPHVLLAHWYVTGTPQAARPA
jgi:hypothetical protein